MADSFFQKNDTAHIPGPCLYVSNMSFSPNGNPSPGIRPADRVAAIQEYYLQRKQKEVAALRAAGIDVISLGIGGPDRMPPRRAIETLCHYAEQPDAHGYQVTAGIPELRRAFSDFYKTHYGVDFDPDKNFLPLIGSKEGILHLTMAFVNPGDAVLVPNPGYPTYSSVSKLMGARIIPYTLKAENDWQPDFDELERLPLDGVRLMWVNYPHMPTGATARMDTFQKIVDFGRRHNIVIVHDNPYSFILNDKPMSIMQVPGAADVCVEMNSLSKSLNMAGWRVGLAVSNPVFINWILKVKSNVDSGQFKPVMMAAAAALSSGPDWYAALNAEYSERRQAAEKVMRALHCSFDPAQRGLFLWGKLPDGCPMDSQQFADFILDKARVFITPGDIFGTAGQGYIRISLCAPATRLALAATRLSSLPF